MAHKRQAKASPFFCFSISVFLFLSADHAASGIFAGMRALFGYALFGKRFFVISPSGEVGAVMSRTGMLFNSLGSRRLLVGLGQGMVLFGLERASAKGLWPGTNHFLFTPLYLLALYVPIVTLLSFGRLSGRRLVLWVGLVALVLTGLALHDVYRRIGVPQDAFILWWDKVGRPSFGLVFCAAVTLFIAHSLVLAAVEDGKAIAGYPAYFDIAWKQGVQLTLGSVFVGVFWMILWLGATLFDVLHLGFFREVISKSWFAWPATFLALAVSIHLTDVAPGIISGIRRVALTLMSWLLPVLVLIVGGFLVALFATSLSLLWNTRHGAQVVLVAAAALIFFTNAAYQQGPSRSGADGYAPPRLIAWSGVAVGPLAVALVGLAGYATLLRVSQYGWTSSRIILSVIDGVAAVYAVGYALAGPWGTTPRRWLEATNIAASFLIVLVVLALLSPLADPARIAVVSQVARLTDGRIAAEKFDFTTLRFDGLRYGQAALADLAQNPDPSVSKQAAAALTASNRWAVKAEKAELLSADQIIANMVPHPGGSSVAPALAALEIPASLTHAKPACFQKLGQKCNVISLGKADDGMDMVVLLAADRGTLGLVAKVGADGRWSAVATLPVFCPEVREALLNGSYKLIRPELPDVVIGGQSFQLGRPHDYRCRDRE